MRLCIADDHPIFAQGLATLLAEADPSWQVLARARDGREALSHLQTLRPDLAILDLAMPGLTGLEVTRAALAAGLATRILILSMYDDPALIDQARRAGARGYLLKEQSFERLVAVIRALLAGEQHWPTSDPVVRPHLSSREQQVLGLILAGDPNRVIAIRTGLSIKTVETYRARLMHKLAAHNTAQLVQQAQRWGLLPSPPGSRPSDQA